MAISSWVFAFEGLKTESGFKKRIRLYALYKAKFVTFPV